MRHAIAEQTLCSSSPSGRYCRNKELPLGKSISQRIDQRCGRLNLSNGDGVNPDASVRKLWTAKTKPLAEILPVASVSDATKNPVQTVYGRQQVSEYIVGETHHSLVLKACR